MNTTFNVIAENTESTVVSEYTPVIKKSDSFESEAALEKEFIRLLGEQGYQYLPIHTEDDLIANLRLQIERLNDYQFTEKEWDQFFHQYLANANEGIVEKTRTVQEDAVKSFVKEDGTVKNITLIDKAHIHNNSLQVINQYENTGNYDNRYDVTILLNGLPMVHVELKRRGVAIREAFNQIERYQRDSFWANSGLYEYVQIFVISNGTSTKYYSNTTRHTHIEEFAGRRSSKKTSNSFEFTSYWADAKNKRIEDLIDFTKTFLSKHTILNILTKYCVFTAEQLLLVMRPYQITATERIITKITTASNYKQWASVEGGGYIWHTTGSGKTLTSFKTAQLASRMDSIDKVLFVVDRKDLDYQTMKEYDRFEKGAANSNKSTAVLKKQLEDPNCRIIITTIQKLAIFVKQNKSHPVYHEHLVLIFDECHRSQFGEFHAAITKAFRKYHMFGFTGTPIFAENAGKVKYMNFATTRQAFGECLHTYTIIDAINDGNVLPFKVDIIKTIAEKVNIDDIDVEDIDRDAAMKDPCRIAEIVEYIRTHYDQKTKRVSGKGFNSIFAVSSIEFAKLYYNEFKKQQENDPDGKKLKIATIFSYGPNEEVESAVAGELIDENSDDASGLDQSSRDFLESAIMDYNMMFHTQFSTDGDGFQNYYKDVSMRMKHNEVDILIVVNMFLTGFDATTLNTLWVDKNLKYHGLLQAFSRTNRILNSIKTFGNIVCFRNLEKRVNEAIELFGNEDAGGIIMLRNFSDYYYGYTDSKGKEYPGYVELIERLLANYPLDNFSNVVVGEKAEKQFIALYGGLLRLLNILNVFDDFADKHLLSDMQMQDYQSHYADLYDKWRRSGGKEKVNINDDVVFEIELIKQMEVNIDYILNLIAESKGKFDGEIIARIRSAMSSSFQLRSKAKLIEDFVNNLTGDDVNGQWKNYIEKQIVADLDQIIDEEHLKSEETYRFVSFMLDNQRFDTSGVMVANILPPVSRFGGKREAVKDRVIAKLNEFFDRYWDLGVNLPKA